MKSNRKPTWPNLAQPDRLNGWTWSEKLQSSPNPAQPTLRWDGPGYASARPMNTPTLWGIFGNGEESSRTEDSSRDLDFQCLWAGKSVPFLRARTSIFFRAPTNWFRVLHHVSYVLRIIKFDGGRRVRLVIPQFVRILPNFFYYAALCCQTGIRCILRCRSLYLKEKHSVWFPVRDTDIS